MGALTDARIQAFQDSTGIKPPQGAELAILGAMQTKAAELLEVLALEKSGIRDGDGTWYGSDAVGGLVANLAELEGMRVRTDNQPKEEENHVA
jgi:hypothetical protein